MKRKVILVCILALGVTAYMTAQVMGTVGVDVTAIGGVQMTNPVTEESASTTTELPKLPFPYAQLVYNFDRGMVDIGLGAKVYTLVFVSALYPLTYVDVDLGLAVLHGGIGGGLFYLFTPFAETNFTKAGNVFLPELGAYLKIGKSLQIGASVIFLVSDMQEITAPFIGCISARFVFDIFGHSEQ